MIKQRKKILVISIGLICIIGGIAMKLGTPFDHFLTHDYSQVNKNDQIAYLKKHEKEMTDYVKAQNSKVTSVQWDWESVKVETVQPNAGGIPTGDKYKEMIIKGGFNNIKESSVTLNFDYDIDKVFPSINDMMWSSDSLRVVKEINDVKVGVNYE